MSKQNYIIIAIVLFMLCLFGGAYSLVWYTYNKHKENSITKIIDETSLQEINLVNPSALAKLEPIQEEAVPRYILNAAVSPLLPKNTIKIAIILDDLGMHESIWPELESLPTAITYSYLPYGKYTSIQSKLARKLGHDIMIHLPMEPKIHENGNIIDPGPNALYTNMNWQEIVKLTNINLQELKQISVGVNNHMGSKFSEFKEGLQDVLKIVNNEKMFFLDSVTTNKSVIPQVAKEINIPFLKRDIFIDHSQEIEDIHKMLKKLEERAKKQGYAIAIGHPHKNTFNALNEWITTLKEKNITLVPITNLLNIQNTQPPQPMKIAPIQGYDYKY